MFNEIFRMSGAHDLKLEIDEADEQQDMSNVGNEQFLTQLREQWPQVLKMLEALVQKEAQAQQMQGEPGSRPAPSQPEQQAMTSPEQQVQIWAKKKPQQNK